MISRIAALCEENAYSLEGNGWRCLASSGRSRCWYCTCLFGWEERTFLGPRMKLLFVVMEEESRCHYSREMCKKLPLKADSPNLTNSELHVFKYVQDDVACFDFILQVDFSSHWTVKTLATQISKQSLMYSIWFVLLETIYIHFRKLMLPMLTFKFHQFYSITVCDILHKGGGKML